MLDQFLRYIDRYQLVGPDEKILLTVSGGIDSVVLTHLFTRSEKYFAIAHCNFHLRGEESDEDAVFVEELARSYAVPFHIKHFETESYAKNRGISIQMAARDLRAAWFEQLLTDSHYHLYATAHHLNDAIETLLFNLTKGTGIAGLHGILPKNGHVIRPMLFAARSAIEQYASDEKLAWREDSSNTSLKYQRNLIRHKVVPVLKKINPNLEATFSDTFERLGAVEQFYIAHVNDLKNDLCSSQGQDLLINKVKLSRLENPGQILFELIRPFHFNYYQAGEIALRLGGAPGKLFHSSSHTLNIDRDFLIISGMTEATAEIKSIGKDVTAMNIAGGVLHFNPAPMQSFRLPHDRMTAFLDQDKLKYPLELRKWQKGDAFVPLGMRGKKKVSDFMIDEKIPLTLKENLLVLTSSKDIVWMVGYRIDDRFKITEGTGSVLKIWFEKNDQSV